MHFKKIEFCFRLDLCLARLCLLSLSRTTKPTTSTLFFVTSRMLESESILLARVLERPFPASLSRSLSVFQSLSLVPSRFLWCGKHCVETMTFRCIPSPPTPLWLLDEWCAGRLQSLRSVMNFIT